MRARLLLAGLTSRLVACVLTEPQPRQPLTPPHPPPAACRWPSSRASTWQQLCRQQTAMWMVSVAGPGFKHKSCKNKICREIRLVDLPSLHCCAGLHYGVVVLHSIRYRFHRPIDFARRAAQAGPQVPVQPQGQHGICRGRCVHKCAARHSGDHVWSADKQRHRSHPARLVLPAASAARCASNPQVSLRSICVQTAL